MAATTSNIALNQYSSAVSGGTTPSDLFIRDVPDWTRLLRRTDTPLLKLIGGLKTGSAPKVPMLKAEWGWGTPDPMKDTLGGAMSDTSTLTVTVSNGAYFQAGDIIRVDSEDLLVASISSNTLTTTARGFRGTTAATHLNGANVYKIGIAIAENANDPLSPITQGEVDYNYSEIIIFNWQLSERAKVTPTYESRNFSGNRFEQELKKKMNDTAPVYLERMLIDGLRYIGTSTAPSTMGGLRETGYITTRTAAAAAPLTEYMFMDTHQTVYNLVGLDRMAHTVVCGSLAKRIVNSWYNDTRRTTGSDSTINVSWDTIKTDLGDFKFVVDYQLDALGKSDYMYSLVPEDITLRPYASSTGWKTGMLATDGWYDRGFLRADVTAIFQNPDSRALISGFSTTASDYPALA